MKAEKYQIKVQGIIDASWSSYFSGMTLITEPAGVTRLIGEISDQSALHGFLNRIRDLNLKLISLQLIDSDGVTPVECRYCQSNMPGHIKNRG